MTTTPRLAQALTVFHAWWEDYDGWDGNELYLNLDTAKAHAAFSYEGEEYGHLNPDSEDDDEPTARPNFSWHSEHGRWHLYDHGHATGVRVSETTIYRQATPHEIEQQDALTAAEKAARATAPHMPLAMALEHEAAKRLTEASTA